MAPFDLEDLRARGFGGFVAVSKLARPEPPELPVGSGVYVVVRTDDGRPAFLSRSGGGWWKKQDPSVPLDRLRREWVDGAQTLYIGKAKSLRERVGELLQFADGRPVRHWGGRLLWQVERCEDLVLGWREETDFAGVETNLIDEFLNRLAGCHSRTSNVAIAEPARRRGSPALGARTSGHRHLSVSGFSRDD